MGALTQPRLTPQRLDSAFVNKSVGGLASGAQIYMGALVCAQNVGTGNSARLVPGKVATGLRALGVLMNQNSIIPGGFVISTTDGLPRVEIQNGCFKFNIDPNDPVTEQDLFKMVYISSDNEICKTSGGNAKSFAGRLEQIDGVTDPTGPGAWVDVGALATSGFPLPTGLGLP